MITYPVGFLNPASRIPRGGLIGEWTFSGNADDTSGAGNDGTVYGAALTTNRHGVSNRAYSFNGTSDYIEIGDKYDFGLDDRTISVWIYQDVVDGNIKGIISKSLFGGAADRWAIFAGALISTFFDTISNLSLANSTLEWFHIVVTFDRSGLMTMYVNNIFNSSIDISSKVSDNLQNSIILRFGSYNDVSGDPDLFFDGKLDDIRFYNRILTTEEITELYNE